MEPSAQDEEDKRSVKKHKLLGELSSMEVDQLIRKLPKAEQHIHIVGSTRPETLLWLAEDGGLDKPFKTSREAQNFFQFTSFPQFIKVYSTVVDCITKENQFERITYEMLESEAQCNVQYVEASFSPLDHVLRSLDYGKMLDATNRGVKRARMDFAIECNLRIDFVRNYGPEKAMEVLDWVESKDDNIVSVDLGGSEERFPAKPYKSVYQRAKEMGLHLVAHAGEAAGPDSIWQAVTELEVEHIGHGVTAIHEPRLMEHLKKQNIAIEACPTSNIRTRVIHSIKDHPIKAFNKLGLAVTVNTDDPSIFKTDMDNEYLQLHHKLGFSLEELFKLSLNAVNSSFLSEKSKSKMCKSFMTTYDYVLNERIAGA